MGSCEHVDELLNFIKGRGVLDQLGDYQILKKVSAPWTYFLSYSNKKKINSYCTTQ
jgi:hypothetical protein